MTDQIDMMYLKKMFLYFGLYQNHSPYQNFFKQIMSI